MSTNHFLKLEKFEGPLDLLLHLIKVQELEIFDINILALTLQYLEYLRIVQFRDLTEASAFMDMAAQLCEIKSRHLIPSEEKDKEEDQESEQFEERLKERLVDFERFRNAADFLSQKLHMGGLIQKSQEWKRLAPLYEHIESPLKGHSATLLVLYEQMLSELADRKTEKVKALTESFTVDQAMEKITAMISVLKRILLQELYVKFESRYELLAYVLGALQLVRDRHMKIFQEELMGPLWIYPLTEEVTERVVEDEYPTDDHLSL